jgi:hypothetical protein
MSVKIPSSFDFGLDVDLNADADIDLDGNLDVTIPTDYGISIKQLPPIEIKPIDFSLRLKEIPSIRAHLPLNYKVGFSLLGRELACIHLCGQGQAITEPYVPYPCEPQTRRPGGLEQATQPIDSKLESIRD